MLLVPKQMSDLTTEKFQKTAISVVFVAATGHQLILASLSRKILELNPKSHSRPKSTLDLAPPSFPCKITTRSFRICTSSIQESQRFRCMSERTFRVGKREKDLLASCRCPRGALRAAV